MLKTEWSTEGYEENLQSFIINIQYNRCVESIIYCIVFIKFNSPNLTVLKYNFQNGKVSKVFHEYGI